MSKLSDLLNARNTKNLTYREIGRRAEKNGFTLSQASATAIMGGRHGLVSDDLLQAIASVLPVTVEEMRSAQDLAPDPGTPWEPPEVAKHLTLLQRAALEQLIKAIVREEGAHDAGQAEDQKTPHGRGAAVTAIRPGDAYLDQAARTGRKGRHWIDTSMDAAGEESQDSEQ